MKRREFLTKASTGAGAALAELGPAGSIEAAAPSPAAFIPCINQATTMKADFRTAMDAYGKAGFRTVELWLESVEPFLAKESAATARRVMRDHALEPRSACCECEDLIFRVTPERQKKLDAFERKLDLSARLGVHRFVMCSGISAGVTPADYDRALPRLKEVGDLGRQFDIVVGLEFIARARFLGCVETTVRLLRKVAHPNLSVLVDTFHFFAGVSKLGDIETLGPGEISWVHVNDVPALPRELLEDKHRVYVGEGVMPLEKILRAIARVYQGPVSFEVFQYVDHDPYEVARKGFDGLSRMLSRV